jgi:DNA modification methylase
MAASNITEKKVSQIFDSSGSTCADQLQSISDTDRLLFQKYSDVLSTDYSLTRQLVSFQANKKRPVYRWYKYKEAFSASLVEYLLEKYSINQGVMLDPFAGAGTALFAASNLGLDADGIELLPVGQKLIEVRKILDHQFTPKDHDALSKWLNDEPWKNRKKIVELNTLRITEGAYSPKTAREIGQFQYLAQHENEKVRTVLQFALMCILESVSFTRKDGQYLRWDYRSGRRNGKSTFDKGKICDFDTAIELKLKEIISDLHNPDDLFYETNSRRGKIRLYKGSCLDILKSMKDGCYDAIITSPPYCNRYDYTRTYALELALLGIDEFKIKELRQQMLSCTVENREKDLLSICSQWNNAICAANEIDLLQEILSYLDHQRIAGKLNNNGISRMVKGYFYEMACVVFECEKVLKRGGVMLTVNDNVRYAGVSISVDLILSNIAEKLGFVVEKIFVLQTGKGNSSQQMGCHGRDELRKCVYVWRKCR